VKLSSRSRSSLPPGSAFAGFRFPAEVIVVAVRWQLRYGLSYRDVEELLVERGVEVDHVTVFRWVQRFTPLLADAARFCRHPADHALGRSRRGWTTKLHLGCEQGQKPLAMLLTAGQRVRARSRTEHDLARRISLQRQVGRPVTHRGSGAARR